MLGLAAPVEALFQRAEDRRVFAGRDAAAVVVCRGAWRRSQAMLVRRLEAAGANVVGARGFAHGGREPLRLLRLGLYLLALLRGRPQRRGFGLSPRTLAELEAFGRSLGERPRLEPVRCSIETAA